MKLLSIIILVSDKDHQYTDTIVSQIEKHIKCNKEIIIVNNCEKETLQVSNTNCKIISKGYNSYLFEGRRFGFDNSKGDYIWFIDVDDKVRGLLTQENLESFSTDVVQLYFTTDNSITDPIIENIKKEFKMFGWGVWDRFYSRELLNKVYSKVERRDLKIIANEDMILNSMVLELNPSIYFFEEFLYHYNQKRSQQLGTTITQEKLDTVYSGKNDLLYLADLLEDKTGFIKLIETSEAFTRKNLGRAIIDWDDIENRKKCISIVIVFCDKDYKYLENCLDSIERYVLCKHEIILVNNCEHTAIDETLSQKYKVINTNRNTGPWEGRRIGSDNATGDYVWYIDVDDYLIGYVYQSEMQLHNEDLVQMYFSIDGKVNIQPGKFKHLIRMHGFNVWSRLYKREMLDKLYAPIKRRDLKVMRLEDKFIFDLVMESKPTIGFIDRVIYYYDTTKATICYDSITQEVYDKFLSGTTDLPYLYSFVPNSEKHLKEVDDYMTVWKNKIKK